MAPLFRNSVGFDRFSDLFETALRNDSSGGYPVIIKAAGGGGGRGMRVVNREEDLIEAAKQTREEAGAWFSNPMVYLEKIL